MFEARIAELNRFNEQNPVSYDKRTYTVDEIQDILGISRPTAYKRQQPQTHKRISDPAYSKRNSQATSQCL